MWAHGPTLCRAGEFDIFPTRHKIDLLSLNSCWVLTARATLLSHCLNSFLATQYSYFSTWLGQFILLILNLDNHKITMYFCRWPIFNCQLGLFPVRHEIIALFVMQLLSPFGSFFMENVMLDLMSSAYQGANMGLKFCGNSCLWRSFVQPAWKRINR